MRGRVGVAELRLKLASVLDSAASGSVFLVTRSGKDVAVIGPATGGVSALSKEADDCARALVEAQAERDRARAEVARLRNTNYELEEELENIREMNQTTTRKRWGK